MKPTAFPINTLLNLFRQGTLLILILATGCRQAPEKTTEPSTPAAAKPTVAILGVFHFGGSAGDLASIQMPDPFGKRRQTDIEELVAQLAAFQPTRILVEFPKNRQPRLDERYTNFLAGKDSLSVNETEQVGFRLARKLGHPKLYAIDYTLDLPGDGLYEYCSRHNKVSEFEGFLSDIRQYVAGENKMLDTMRIAAYLARTNVDSVDRLTNETYLGKVLEWGDSLSEAGARFSATWWERNMVILKNIAQTIQSKEDRILVIIGSGHRAVLKGLLQNRRDMNYLEVGSFLK